MAAALLVGIGVGRLLRLPPEDRVTVSILFALRNVALSWAIAITILNRIEHAGFAVVYFLAEVPLLLGVMAVYRWQPAPAGPRSNSSGSAG